MGIGGSGLNDEASKEVLNIFRSHGHVELDTALLCKYICASLHADTLISMADLCFLCLIFLSHTHFDDVSYSPRTRSVWRDRKNPGKDIKWSRRDKSCYQSMSRVRRFCVLLKLMRIAVSNSI